MKQYSALNYYNRQATDHLLFLLMAVLALVGCSSPKGLETDTTSLPVFLIPAGFEGSLTIVYDEACGVRPGTENGHPVFRFPKNGLLILNEKESPYNLTGSAYYFEDSAGIRQEIKQVIDRAPGYTTDGKGEKQYEDKGNTTLQNRRQDQPVIIIKGMGVQYVRPINIVNGVTTNQKEAAFSYAQYGVYNNSAVDTTGLMAHPDEDNLLKNRVRACKESVMASKVRTNDSSKTR